MKTKTTFAALVAVAAIAAAFPDSTFAQNSAAQNSAAQNSAAQNSAAQNSSDEGPSAAHVAAQVQGFYDQTRTVETAFYQAHYDRIYRRTTRSRGVMTIARPGKLRFDYLGGNGKVVVSNGSTFTVYEPGDDGAAGQYFQTPVAEEGIPSALAFLTGSARFETDFHYRLADASRFRWDGYVLELRPRVAEASYRRAFLYVDANSATAGVVHRVLIQDHDGNLNRFDFRRMRFNEAVSASRFEFSPPAAARRL